MLPGSGYRFGPFWLDPRSRCLLRDGVELALQPRLQDLLEVMVSRPGELLTKDELIGIGWPNREVADNNLTQAISRLRLTLDADAPERYIQTVSRRGYRFGVTVTRDTRPMTDDELDALVAPHVALLDGRALLETLTVDAIDRAISLFTSLLTRDDTRPLPHVGLANAFLLRYEATRSSAAPDLASFELAMQHAREARRRGPRVGQAWATYGFIVHRAGDHRAALAALIEATTLEPDSWANYVRLGWCTWGEQRVRAARRALELHAGLAVARWLLATVHVARHELVLAEREIDAALSALPDSPSSGFSGAGIYLLKGLLCLARGAIDEAITFFDRELALEARGHVFARDCCAAAWYGKAGAFERRGDRAQVHDALRETLARVPRHPMALAGMFVFTGELPIAAAAAVTTAAQPGAPCLSPIDEAIARALVIDTRGSTPTAVDLVTTALTTAPAGNAGWALPIDPFLSVQRESELWRPATAALRERTYVWV